MLRSLLAILVFSGTLAASTQSPVANPSPQLDTIQIRPNLYMIAGGGGNVAVQIGSDGVIVVDAGASGSADAILSAIREVPHFLPGKNPYVEELTKAYGVPSDAALGRAETLYPEYRRKMRKQ
jgi:hypothetical protein